MNIASMVLREDFYKIINNTLEKYFKSVYGKNVNIQIKGNSLTNRLIVYPHIGTIMTRLPDIRVLKYLLNEYNIRNKPIKNLIAKFYVLCCYLSFGIFASKSLFISDKSIINNSTVIIPANRKIRIYYFSTGYVDAIIKDTFTNKYFDNELSFRLENAYDFVPKIIDHGENWYREEILPGQPLARVKNDRIYEKCMNEVIIFIGSVAERTLVFVNAVDYVKNLYNEIQGKMLVANVNKNIDCYDMVIKIAEGALKEAVLLDAPLPTVNSHGDLQSGNVWVDIKEEKTYIIDWETLDRRSIWYDCATILLSTRRANKLKEMMVNCETETVKNAILMNDSRKEYNMKAVMGIITLEDILFYLDDMLELPQDFGGDIFNRIAKELDLMGWRQEANK